MRKFVWFVLIAAAIWCGYWYLGARGIEGGLNHWLEDRRGEGWQAEATSIATSGFPVGVETVLTDIELVDPETGLGWSAPIFSFEAPLHAPTRIEAIWPENQRIVTPDETIDVTTATMTGTLGVVPGPALALDTAIIDIAELGLASNAGWTASLGSGALNALALDARPNAYDFAFAARNLRPARPHLRILDPSGRIPEVIETLDLDATIDFDAPWDRYAIEDRRPQPTAIDLTRLNAEWGDMQLEAAGQLTVSPDGSPDGKIVVRAVNWREMVAIAESSGALPEALVPTVEQALQILANLSGSPNTIDAPLTFSRGRVSIGPLPLGPAPILQLR